MLAPLFLLASLSQTQIISTSDCVRTLSPMDNFFDPILIHVGRRNKDTSFRVVLKSFATHSDTLGLLQLPLLRNVTPIAILDQEKDRGFIAKLTEGQLCYTGQRSQSIYVRKPADLWFR
jgi:hypothetical protein